MWTNITQDVKYAVRSLTKAPGFTLVAVLTLALGIGANTAIFSVINGALLRPLPFPDADRLVFFWNTNREGALEPLGPGRMVDFRRQATSYTGFAAISHMSFTLTGSGEPERLSGSSVSSSFFDVLGARPFLGQPFHSGAADPAAVVLTHALWARRFGADPAVIGQTITLNGKPRLVMAVMRPDFFWPAITGKPTAIGGPELWVPGGAGDIPRTFVDEDRDMTGNRNAGYIRAVARLGPGVAVAAARAEARTIAERLGQTYPEERGHGATVVGIRDQFFGAVERPLLVIAGAVAFVLAAACANVASLLLGRGAARRRDLAVRRAMGASRGRIVRQLLTESMVLSAAGAAAGLALAWWSSAALGRVASAELGDIGFGIDLRVLLFMLVVTVGSGVAFGIAPALQLSRDNLAQALNDGGSRSSGSRSSRRTRDVLVVAEIAVALVLLVGSLLLGRSFLSLTRVDTGIDTRNLLTFDINLTGERGAYQAQQVQFYEAMLQRLAQVPGVRSAGAAVTLPIGGDDFGAGYTIEGRPTTPGNELRAGYQVVAPGYFRTMGIPLKQGREMGGSDTRTSMPVMLVNETLARQQWSGQDPVGKRIRLGDDDPWSTIVGVVGDIRHLGPTTPPRAEVYQVISQRSFPFLAVVVRTDGDPYRVVPAIRDAVAELDPNLPLAGIRTMEEHLTRALARPRFLSALVASFGGLAIALSLVGIYGMMSWSVVQRRQEIAIRMALGARASDVMSMVLGKALWLAAGGIAAGLVGAVALTNVLTGLLFGISATDPLTFVVAPIGLVFVALVAGAIPALRASRIQGASVLRS